MATYQVTAGDATFFCEAQDAQSARDLMAVAAGCESESEMCVRLELQSSDMVAVAGDLLCAWEDECEDEAIHVFVPFDSIAESAEIVADALRLDKYDDVDRINFVSHTDARAPLNAAF